MKQFFNLDDDFEQFLSNAAEQQRMYPSDRVWGKIDDQLHGENRRWPGLGFCAILIGSIITAGLILVHPDKDLFNIAVSKSKTTQTVANNNKSLEKAPLIAFHAPEKTNKNTATFGYIASEGSAETIRTDSDLNAVNTTSNEHDNYQTAMPLQMAEYKIEKAVLEMIPQLPGNLVVNSNTYNESLEGIIAPLETTLVENAIKTINETANDDILQPSVDLSIAKTGTPVIGNVSSPKKTNPWNIEFYGTPSISYRYINENKPIDIHINNGAPLAPNVTRGAENFMRQKPSVGFEVGTAILYSVTPKFRLKAGLQMNLRQYDIEAYGASTEQTQLILNYSTHTDTLFGLSALSSNNPVGKQVKLTNKYWQIAIPIGFDLKLIETKKVNVYVAGTIQPTYQLNKKMYLLSSDYKNYVQQADLVRHFNVNTAVEAFISFKAGGLNWQAGPQIRYQAMPTVNSAYTIHENLIDYGFKIGIVKRLK